MHSEQIESLIETGIGSGPWRIRWFNMGLGAVVPVLVTSTGKHDLIQLLQKYPEVLECVPALIEEVAALEYEVLEAGISSED